ncbi:hypothetical protein BTVI_87164 [Pitangus sulphuratus]|nr:hypothetical protein BTVI_87164 [Pitangus sulphuratus]
MLRRQTVGKKNAGPSPEVKIVPSRSELGRKANQIIAMITVGCAKMPQGLKLADAETVPLWAKIECSSGNQQQDERKWSQAVPGKIQVGHQEEFPHRRGCQALEQAAQGCGGMVDMVNTSLEMFKKRLDVTLSAMV